MADDDQGPSVPELPQQPTAPEPVVAPQASTPESASPAQVAPEGKKGRGRTWIVVGVVVAVVVLGVIGWYGYQLTTARSAAQDALAEATTLIESADQVVLEIDEIVRAEVTAAVGQQAADAQPKVDPATADLKAAITMLDEAKPDLRDEDVEQADALIASAEARIKMLAQATPILEANVAAGAAIDPAEKGWALALDGEKLADQSVAEYNKLTKDSVSKSATLTAQSEAKFKEAKTEFDKAHAAFPAAGLDVYIVYIDQKLAALALSRKADTAFLAGDNAKANEYSNQYNAKDKQVIELAKKLPDSPSAAIADAYEKLAGEPTKLYFEARAEATAADDALRALSE